MRPIVNVPEEDRDTDIGNMHKKFGKDRECGSSLPEISSRTVRLVLALCLVMVAQCNRADHYIFILFLLLSFFFFFLA